MTHGVEYVIAVPHNISDRRQKWDDLFETSRHHDQFDASGSTHYLRQQKTTEVFLVH
jgi:hypothetical protein